MKEKGYKNTYDEPLDIMEDDNNPYFLNEGNYYNNGKDSDFNEDDLDDAFECFEKKRKQDSYSESPSLRNAFSVHNALDLNAHPTHEELCSIMYDYHHGNREKAQRDMIAIMDSYLIHLIITKYHTYVEHHMEELMSQGYLGILIGMQTYDPNRGMPTTWFMRYIHHEIQAYINSQVNHTTQHYNVASKLVYACIDRKKKNNIPYTKGDIYRETGVPLKTIEKCMRIKEITTASLNNSEKDKELPAEYGDPQQYMEQKAELEMIDDLILGERAKTLLSDEERACIVLRFGFDGKGCRSFTQIEQITGIPKYHIGKIQAAAIKKIKEVLDRDIHKNRSSKSKKNEGIDQYIFGDLLSDEEMNNDQDEITKLFKMGLLD